MIGDCLMSTKKLTIKKMTGKELRENIVGIKDRDTCLVFIQVIDKNISLVANEYMDVTIQRQVRP